MKLCCPKTLILRFRFSLVLPSSSSPENGKISFLSLSVMHMYMYMCIFVCMVLGFGNKPNESFLL